MKRKKGNYLSYRCIVFAVILVVLAVLLPVLLTVFRTQERIFYTLLIVFGILFAVLIYAGYWLVYRPYQETNKVYHLFAEGYLLQTISDIQYPLTKQMEEATNKFKEMLDVKEMIRLTKKQTEYLALQNQINPHFLYNTLEGIRSEAMCAGMDSLAEMTEALATFFRYNISNLESLVTLEDELTNVENYCQIQQFRFGDRVSLKLEFNHEEEQEILKCKLPKFTLQPIVENAIFHGIERKVENGELRIKIENTPDRCIITVSDDGLGMDDEKLLELNERLTRVSIQELQREISKKGGIALVNVNNRIKLLFGDEYGIYVYSKRNVGTDVEIALPIVKD